MNKTLLSLISLLLCGSACCQPFTFRDLTWGASGVNPFGDIAEAWHFYNFSAGIYKATIYSGDNLTAFGAQTYTTNTFYGQTTHFVTQGTTGGLGFSDNTKVGMGPGVSFTYTVWLNFPVAPNQPIVAKFNFTSNNDYELTSSSGSIYWLTRNVANNAFTQIQCGTNAPSLNTWHFVVFGYDDSIQKTFCSLDNQNYTNQTCVGVILNAAVSFRFGQHDNAGAVNSYRGDIEECYLWRRVLSTSEINFLWNNGVGSFYPVDAIGGGH